MQWFLPTSRTFCHFYQIWNCRLQTLLVWKSLKLVVWERVQIMVHVLCSMIFALYCQLLEWYLEITDTRPKWCADMNRLRWWQCSNFPWKTGDTAIFTPTSDPTLFGADKQTFHDNESYLEKLKFSLANFNFMIFRLFDFPLYQLFDFSPWHF